LVCHQAEQRGERECVRFEDGYAFTFGALDGGARPLRLPRQPRVAGKRPKTPTRTLQSGTARARAIPNSP